MKRKMFIIALAALLVVGATQIVLSQGFGRRGKGFGFGRGMMGYGPGIESTSLLTEEQAQKLRAIRTEFQKEVQPLRTEIQKRSLDLRQLWRADEIDEDAILAKTKEINGLRMQLQEKAIHHRIVVRKIIPKEKWEAFSRSSGRRGMMGFGPMGMGFPGKGFRGEYDFPMRRRHRGGGCW